MSHCRSSDFSHQPFSQSQKMSIGIVVESAAPRPRKESALPTRRVGTEKEAAGTQRVTVEHNVDQGVTALAPNMATKHSDRPEKRASSPATTSSLRGKLPVMSGGNQSLLQRGVGRKRDAESRSQHEGKRAGTDGRAEKLSSAPEQVHVPVEEVPQEQPIGMETGRKETLRMNLRQILGASLFSNEKVDDGKSFEGSTHEMVQEPNAKDDLHSKPRQNSDSIETDSENVGLTTTRPVTRSRARSKAPATRQTRKLKPTSLSSDRETKKGNSSFSCAEKSVPSQSCGVNREYFITERIGGVKRSLGIKPGDMLLPIKDLKNNQSVMTAGEKSSHMKELPSCSVARLSPPVGDLNENIEVTMQNVNVNHSPAVSEQHQSQDSEDPVLQEKSEPLGTFVFQAPAQKDDGSSCPFFNLRKTVLNTPLGFSSVNKDKKQHVQGSPHAADQYTREDKCLSTSSPATENDSDSDATATPDDRHNTATPDDRHDTATPDNRHDTATPEDRHDTTQDSSSEDKDAEKGLFSPTRAESDRTEEVYSIKKARFEDVQTSPEIGLVDKPMYSRKKRRCQDVDADDFSPAFTVPRGDFDDFSPAFTVPRGGFDDDFSPAFTVPRGGKMDDTLMDASEENMDDGLARIIPILGLALEKVKNKMTLVTSRRCSAILMSAAEEIHSQLQDVESQIQTDLGKLTCLKTAKRKHLETRLQEQQEHLKVIHEKFKEEIHKYLQDCRGSVEGLETQHTELKGAIERQKASHRKLVSQAEAAVETHLIDTQRKVKSVHKVGEQKMQQLRAAIGECLKDVILS